MKTQAELLKAYKKANKERREAIANKAGFNSGDDYQSHLVNQIALQSKTKMVIHNVYVLDKSGSMDGGKLRSALEGINKEIEDLKIDPEVDYLQTFVPFSYGNKLKRIPRELFREPIANVGHLTARATGYTALYQALGETLEDAINSQKEGEKVLVKVFTDGGENDSKGRYRDGSELNKLIKKAEEKDITVTFVGTRVDVRRVIDKLGVDESNTLSHDNTEAGVASAFAATTRATKTYASKSLAGEDTLKGFYKKSGKL